MEAIPVEFSKILRRVKILASGPRKYSEVLNPKFKDDILLFKSLELNPNWAPVAKSLYPEIQLSINEIKIKKETIFLGITEYLKYTITKDVSEFDSIEGFEPEVQVDPVIVNEKLRKEWFAAIEDEINEYEISILKTGISTSIQRTGSFKLKMGITDDLLDSLFDLIISNSKGNEEFINKYESGNKEEFRQVFKCKDFSKLDIHRQFKFDCQNGFVAFIFHWLNEKGIISGGFQAVESSNFFVSKADKTNKSITADTLKNALFHNRKSSSFDNIMNKKPTKISLEHLEEDSSPKEIVEYLHNELSYNFFSARK